MSGWFGFLVKIFREWNVSMCFTIYPIQQMLIWNYLQTPPPLKVLEDISQGNGFLQPGQRFCLLLLTVDYLWQHIVTNKTRHANNTSFTHFERFMLLHGYKLHSNINMLPFQSEDILIYFVPHCFDTLNVKYSTIKLYL